MIEASHGRVRGAGLLGVALPGAIACVAAFWLAFDNGSYGTTTWAGAGVVAWWTVGLAALGVLPASRLSAPARGAAVLLVLLALWSLASTGWAADRNAAYDEAGRVALYAAGFLLVALTVRGRAIGAFLDGLAAGLVAVAVVALAGRLFPGFAPTDAAARALPAVVSRLSWPVGYWNGLAMLVGLAVPLLLRTAATNRSRVAGACAVAAIVPVGCVVYLASSRGGALVAVVGALAFVLLGGTAVRALAAAATGFAAAAVAVAVLASRDALVDGPFDSAAAASQGRSAAALLVLLVLVSGAVWLALERILRNVRPPGARARTAIVALVAVGVVAAVAVSSPVARVHAFTAPPVAPDARGFVATHLLSGSGSGRWQFWQAAVDQWRAAPLKGQGAGSFQTWWAQHGTLQMFVRDPHSLYVGSLGELGIVGFLLAVLLWGGGCAAACTTAVRREGETRPAAAATAAVAVAFAVGVGLDWLWELPAVGLVGVAALALALAPAHGRAWRPPAGGRVALAVLAAVAVLFELVPLLGAKALDGSRAAAAAGRPSDAEERALRAQSLEPWAVAPLEQLALLAESRGELAAAHTWIGRAIHANPQDWQARVIAARIATKRGRIAAARGELAVARRLNPRSPLLADRR